MNNVIVLPHVPSSMQQQYAESAQFYVITALQTASLSIDELSVHFRAITTAAVDVVVGSHQTPFEYWATAISQYPNAMLLVSSQTNNTPSLYHLTTGLAWQQKAEPSVKKTIPPGQKSVVPALESAPLVQDVAEVISRYPEWDDNKLLFKVFLTSAWGAQDKSDLKSKLHQYEEDIIVRAQKDTTLLTQFKKKVAQGDFAYQQGGLLNNKLRQHHSKLEIEQWIEKVCQGQAKQVKKHLLRIVSDYEQYSCNRHKKQNSNVDKSTITALAAITGNHPNSITQLPVEQEYHVYIDETGADFDQNTDGKEAVGKYAAVVIPASITLPDLIDFHGTDETPKCVDAVVQTLLDHKIGILGFNSRDGAVQTSVGWLSGIIQLVRWVAYLIPSSSKGKTRLKVSIEERGAYKQYMSMEVLENLIFSELSSLDARFENINIKLNFAPKNHPMMGYADAVAFTWGSPKAVNRDRLKKTQLSTHCLFNPNEAVFEKLYLMANSQGKLLPDEWYQLCSALPIGAGLATWLSSFMNKVSSKVTCDRLLWQSYLHYVRERLALKDYQTKELAAALQFLQRSAPKGLQLSPELELQLISAQLSATSHLGKLDKALFDKAIALIERVFPENAHLACEGVLRLFSMSTNVFDSTSLEPLLTAWLNIDQCELIMGRSRYGKLLSTLGQFHAFKHEYHEAELQFKKAITVFEQLQDSREADRELAQTRCYLINVLLKQDDAMNACCEHVESLLHNVSVADVAELARSGQTHTVFAHHVIVKALIIRPRWFSDELKEYLMQQPHWQSGQTHPWQWIECYRALLCMIEDNESANAHFYKAQAICDITVPIFEWTHIAIQQIRHTLNANELVPSAAAITHLSDKLKAAPVHEFSLSPEPTLDAIMAWLESVLPFNLH